MKKTILSFTLLLTILMVGCTSGNSENAANTDNQAQNANLTKKNLCELLPINQVSKLANANYTNTEIKFADDRASIVDCRYYNEEGQSVTVIVNIDDGVIISAEEQFKSLKDYLTEQTAAGFPLEMVDGVGAEAFFASTGFITQINAINKDRDTWVTLTVTAPGSDDDRKKAAKDLANAVFKAVE